MDYALITTLNLFTQRYCAVLTAALSECPLCLHKLASTVLHISLTLTFLTEISFFLAIALVYHYCYNLSSCCDYEIFQVHFLALHKSFCSRTAPFLPSPPTPHYPLPRTTTFLAYERSVCFASCKTPGVQHRASLPVPCQRELACGKARLFQILLLFATHATSKSRKPYLPSRLRDRRPDYLHFRKHRQPRTIPRPALPKIQIYRRRRSPQLFIIHYSLFITHKNPAVPFPKQQGHKY